MTNVVEVEAALYQLPRHDKWEVARRLLDDLETNGDARAEEAASLPRAPLPDYAARRRQIFGDKVLPNLVLTAREEERW